MNSFTYLTTEEMIDALESVLEALYQQTDRNYSPKLLEATENTRGLLWYDFSVIPPEPKLLMIPQEGFKF